MPVIEIHGFISSEFVEGVLKDSDLPFKMDIGIEPISPSCYNLEHQSKPYLRICDTDHKRAEKVFKVLEKLNYDVDILILKRFYPSGF